MLLLLFAAAEAQQCSTPYTRSSWRTLSEAQKQNYLTSIQNLKSRAPGSAGDMASWNYDQFVDVHYSNQAFAHSVPAFLPWHRQFLLGYERALRSVGMTIPLPYWDWSLNSQAPGGADVFSPQYFGGNGQGANRCVTDGKFANWRVTVPESRCLTRCFAFSTFWSPEAIAYSLTRSADFNSARNNIEGGPHGPIHLQIGGDNNCGDMSTMHSTNDPLFFMHHANIDRLWFKWQMACKDRLTAYNGPGASMNEPLAGLPGVASDVLNPFAPNICYTYGPSDSDRIAITAANCPAGAVTGPGAPTVTGSAVVPAPTNITLPGITTVDWFTPLLQQMMPNVKAPASALKRIGVKRDAESSSETATATTTEEATPTITQAPTVQPYLPEPTVMPVYVPPANMTIVAPQPGNLTDLVNLRQVPNLPLSYIQTMRMNPVIVRHAEVLSREAVDRYNNLDGYISIAALQNWEHYNPPLKQ